MNQAKEIEKVQRRIVTILARMLVVATESIKTDVPFREYFNSDADAVHAFAVQVENTLGVMVGDSALSAHPTVAELAAYCVARRAAMQGGHLYVVVCRMPGGVVRESIYAARNHEKAVEQAKANGAEAVLTVEREDAEDGSPRRQGVLGKVIVPLFLGGLLAGAVLLFFWWKNGFEQFW